MSIDAGTDVKHLREYHNQYFVVKELLVLQTFENSPLSGWRTCYGNSIFPYITSQFRQNEKNRKKKILKIEKTVIKG